MDREDFDDIGALLLGAILISLCVTVVLPYVGGLIVGVGSRCAVTGYEHGASLWGKP